MASAPHLASPPRENTFELEGSIPGLPNPTPSLSSSSATPRTLPDSNISRVNSGLSATDEVDSEERERKRKMKQKDPAVLVNVSGFDFYGSSECASSCSLGEELSRCASQEGEWGSESEEKMSGAAYEGREWAIWRLEGSDQVLRTPYYRLAKELSGFGWE